MTRVSRGQAKAKGQTVTCSKPGSLPTTRYLEPCTEPGICLWHRRRHFHSPCFAKTSKGQNKTKPVARFLSPLVVVVVVVVGVRAVKTSPSPDGRRFSLLVAVCACGSVRFDPYPPATLYNVPKISKFIPPVWRCAARSVVWFYVGFHRRCAEPC